MRTQENLILKIGAQIMTVINDPGGFLVMMEPINTPLKKIF